MKKFLLIAFLALLTWAGCRQIVFWKYGMHQPEPETPESLVAFLKEMNQQLPGQYIFSDSASYLKFIWSPFFSKHLMHTLFYTERGYMNQFVDSNKCQWSGGYFIARLKRDTLYATDTSNRYQTLLKSIVPLAPATTDGEDAGPCDFTLLVPWGKFIGRYNERLFANDLAIGKNRGVTIRVIYLNIDMQKSWNLREDQKLIFK